MKPDVVSRGVSVFAKTTLDLLPAPDCSTIVSVRYCPAIPAASGGSCLRRFPPMTAGALFQSPCVRSENSRASPDALPCQDRIGRRWRFDSGVLAAHRRGPRRPAILIGGQSSACQFDMFNSAPSSLPCARLSSTGSGTDASAHWLRLGNHLRVAKFAARWNSASISGAVFFAPIFWPNAAIAPACCRLSAIAPCRTPVETRPFPAARRRFQALRLQSPPPLHCRPR